MFMKQLFTAALLGCALFAIPASAQFRMPTELKKAQSAPTRAGAEDVIYDPQGTTVDYTKTYSGYFAYMSLEHIVNQEVSAQIVWGENNDVYFADIISMMPIGSYVKGEVNDNVITVKLPQLTGYEEYEYDGEEYVSIYGLTLLKGEVSGVGEDAEIVMYEPVEGECQISFTISDDGTITMDPLEENYALGLTYDEGYGEEMWFGFAEYEMKFTPKTGEEFDPATLPTTPYSYLTSGYDTPATPEPEFGHKINVAFDGDDIYFIGISIDEPSWWIKGQRDGNKVIVDNNQKMGTLMNTYTVSLMFAKRDPEAYGGFSLLPADTQFVFNYDEEKNVFTTDTPEVIMLVNALPDQIYYLTMLEDPTFTYQPNAAGNPRDPWNFAFFDYYDKIGYGVFDFYLPIVSTDNVLLNRDNMYYQIYIDGEVQELDAAQYGLPEDTENVPYNFDKNAIVCSKISSYHEMLVYVEGFETIGVKLFNVYDGVTYESNLVELNMETGEVSGLNNIAADANVVSETFYDLSGKKVSKPANGIFVKRVVLDNGTVKNIKCVVK